MSLFGVFWTERQIDDASPQINYVAPTGGSWTHANGTSDSASTSPDVLPELTP